MACIQMVLRKTPSDKGAVSDRHNQISGGNIFAGILLALCSSASALAQQSPELPGLADSPFATVFQRENLPTVAERNSFPESWTVIYASPSHNAVVATTADMPEWLRNGVSWRFAEARAWPLDKPAFDAGTLGLRGAQTTAAQWLGNAVGVSAAQGMVFAASSDQFIYALNARTGRLIWRASPVPTTWMGQPLVSGDLVFANAGTVGFNYSNLQAFAKDGKAVRGAGVAYNGIYAFDRETGALRWRYATVGDAMPTPAISDKRLILSDGSGTVTALDTLTGRKLWATALGGMGNMSSPAIDDHYVYVGMASPAFLFALDQRTGKVAWKSTLPGADNTGMGDVAPALAEGIVVTDAVSGHRTQNGVSTTNFTVGAFDAKTGALLWMHKLGRGKTPPSYKGGVPMIQDGVAYVGSPVTNTYHAFDLRTGTAKWSWTVPNPSESGSGRGPAAIAGGKLYITTGPSIYMLDPKTGKLLGMKSIGGRFGIAGPTIVGGTLYTANTSDWVLAMPLSDVAPIAAKPPVH